MTCRAIWGWSGVAGTLDSKGMTPEGIAGADSRAEGTEGRHHRRARSRRSVGDPPRLTEVPTPSTGGSAYYALAVEGIIPPGEKPFDAVKDQVLDDWKQDQRRPRGKRARHRDDDGRAGRPVVLGCRDRRRRDAPSSARW